MINFSEIAHSVSRYTAMALAATMKHIPLTSLRGVTSNANSRSRVSYGRNRGDISMPTIPDLQAPTSIEPSTEQTLLQTCLDLVRVEITNQGMVIRIMGASAEEIDVLRVAFQNMNLNVDEYASSNHSSSSSNQTGNTLFLIQHNQVFRLLFRLGFDGRDVFDAYEAARIRGALHFDAPQTGPVVHVAYRQYAAMAKLTKDLEGMLPDVKFQCRQISRDARLEAIPNELDRLYTLLTKEIADYPTISMARAAIYDQLQHVVQQFGSVLQDPDFYQAPKKSLHNKIFSNFDAMAASCLFYADAIWSQFTVKPLAEASEEAAVAVVSEPLKAASEEASTVLAAEETADISSKKAKFKPEETFNYTDIARNNTKITLRSRVGRIVPNPITGNVQIGAVIETCATEVPSNTPLHVIFIVDVSGSMGDLTFDNSRISAASQLVGAVTEQLQSTDYIDIMVFGQTARHTDGGFATEAKKTQLLTRNQRNDICLSSAYLSGVNRDSTHLDEVAKMLPPIAQADQLIGCQTIVMLLSDGGTDASHAATLNYVGNPGASSLVRDTLLEKWHLNSEQTRFVAMGIGSGVSCDVIKAFADDNDFLLMDDSDISNSARYTSLKNSFLLKCKPFTQVAVSATLTTTDGLHGFLETTQGRDHSVAYIELIAKMLQQRGLPMSLILNMLIPFLEPKRFLCLSQTECVQIPRKFVIPHAHLVSSLSLFVRPTVSSSSDYMQSNMGHIEETDPVDDDLNTQITSYEQAVTATQSNQGGGMDNARNYQARSGRR